LFVLNEQFRSVIDPSMPGETNTHAQFYGPLSLHDSLVWGRPRWLIRRIAAVPLLFGEDLAAAKRDTPR
jgi:hypothetical protein